LSLLFYFFRKIDFLLTGIKVRFDSRVGTIEGQEGIQWIPRGDDYSRSFSLIGRKELGKYYIENIDYAEVAKIDVNTHAPPEGTNLE
jgi:hypothetical protein